MAIASKRSRLINGNPGNGRVFTSSKASRAHRVDFYRSLAHVLKDPLVGSLGYVDYLFEGYAGKLSAEQLEELGCARSSMRQLAVSIDALLDLAAFDMNIAHLNRRKVDLRDWFAEASQDLVDWCQVEEHSLSLKVPRKPLKVRVDSNWLRALIIELVSNALRVSAKGSTIRIVLSRKDQWVQVQLKDQGPGLTDKRLRILFEPLNQFRGASDPPRGQRGGLGLALAKRIVEAHEGRISARRAKPKGLVVTAIFPVVQ